MSAWLSALFVSIGLPWLMGTLVMYRLGKSGGWNPYLLLGHGYVLGIFLTTVFMRALDWAGLPINLAAIVVIQVLCVLGLLASLRGSWPRPDVSVAQLMGRTGRSPVQSPLASLATAGFMLLIGLRLFTLTQDLLLQPLFAWDAWMNWLPKALLYYEYGELTNFVSPEQWLAMPPDAGVYTLGNYSAWAYPITVPLIQYWGMLSIDGPDSTMMLLHWPVLALSLGLALFGHLRASGHGALLAVVACYLLLSLPYLDVHVTLAGYADIWLAAAFSLSTFCLYSWHHHREPAFALLGLVYAVMCMTLKMPGIIMGAMLLLCYALSLLRLPPRLLVCIPIIGLLAIACVAWVGVDASMPVLGRVVINLEQIVMWPFGVFEVAFHPVQGAFARTLFMSNNWHIAWPLSMVAVLGLLMSKNTRRAECAALMALAFLMVFYFLVFFFTGHARTALDFTALNRALLYALPVMIFLVALSFQALAVQVPALDRE